MGRKTLTHCITGWMLDVTQPAVSLKETRVECHYRVHLVVLPVIMETKRC